MNVSARIAYIVAEVKAGNENYLKALKPEPVKGGDRKCQSTPPEKPSGSQGSTGAR